MSKTTIVYKDIAPGAAEDSTVSSAAGTSFSRLNQLPFENDTDPVASLEHNCWLLGGTHVAYDTQELAFWSEDVSGNDCTFSAASEITVQTSFQYSSVGVSLVFDGDSWPTDMTVKWYRDETLLASESYQPDSLAHFCEKQVESYNRIELSFSKMSLPNRRLKIRSMIFGLRREFGMEELRSASVVNDMSLVSTELPISTLKWTLDCKADVDFMFQLKQPVEARNNGRLLGVYYIDKYSRQSPRIYDIECYDAIGVLNEVPFVGGVYTNKSAKEILSEILDGAFTIQYADNVEDMQLTGAIPACKKREAIQQVLFPWGVCAATDGGNSIRVFRLGEDYTEIGAGRTFTGAQTETAAIVTAVYVTAHEYVETANGDVEIDGRNYKDNKTVYSVLNPNVTANDKQNVVQISNASLVSPAIAQSVAQRVYNYYQKRNKAAASIVWDGERLGDAVTVPNSWGGTHNGNIGKMEIKLSNTVVAKTEVTGT